MTRQPVKRGEIWTMAGGSGYASKPRPVVIVQDDAFTARDSIVVCLITTEPIDLPRSFASRWSPQRRTACEPSAA